MNIKTVFLCVLAVLCIQANLTWGGTIYSTVPMRPLNLKTPLGNLTPKEKMIWNIACVDTYSGRYGDCAYDLRINGLVQPDSAVENNGGHSQSTHTGTRPFGDLQMTFPTTGAKTQRVKDQTKYNYVKVEHTMPEVSGKLEILFDFYVQKGWHTVEPEPCDNSYTYWCVNTTVDVGVNNLTSLPDAPSLYKKFGSPSNVNHTNAVSFNGTDSAKLNLSSIADWYNQLTWKTLSINDMSLPKGGLFDVNGNYSSPHTEHRTGESADINKDTINGVLLDCTKNKSLLLSVLFVMGLDGGSKFANRTLERYGHFLCETGNNNNIHIDL